MRQATLTLSPPDAWLLACMQGYGIDANDRSGSLGVEKNSCAMPTCRPASTMQRSKFNHGNASPLDVGTLEGHLWNTKFWEAQAQKRDFTGKHVGAWRRVSLLGSRCSMSNAPRMQDTSWLDTYLSEIPHVVYQIDEPNNTVGAQHATIANKGDSVSLLRCTSAVQADDTLHWQAEMVKHLLHTSGEIGAHADFRSFASIPPPPSCISPRGPMDLLVLLYSRSMLTAFLFRSKVCIWHVKDMCRCFVHLATISFKDWIEKLRK